MPLPLIPLAISLATEFAPSLIRYFAGDSAGDVATKVVDVAKSITGTDDGDAAAAALRANPELALAFKQRMADVELETERAYLHDRQDARARDVQLAEMGHKNSRANWMIVGDVIGLLACLIAIFGLLSYGREVKSFGELLVLLTTIANFFGLSLRDAHQFEFGSSRGSAEKDKIIASSR
jgi:hypothetical protein